MAARLRCGWLAVGGLDRYRPVFMVMQGALFIIGALFWIDAMGDGVGFTEETWGYLAYSLPAWSWAFMNMGASAITLNGLIKPVNKWMVVVGSCMHSVQFLVLSYSAVFCGGVIVIGLYASIFFLPLHMWLLIEALYCDD